VLSSLMSKSFVRMQRGSYTIHSFLKRYGIHRLNENPREREETLHRHCEFYMGFLKARDSSLKGGRQKEALASIEEVIVDVRQGWRWGAEHRFARELAAATGPLFLFYDMRGWLQEGREAFHLAAERFDNDDVHLDAYGRLIAREGAFCTRLSLVKEAESLLTRALEIARASGDPAEEAFALFQLSYVSWSKGQFIQAEESLLRGLDIYRKLGDRWGEARALNNLGFILTDQGEYERSAVYLEESLRLFEEMEDSWGMAKVLNNLGILHLNRGEYEDARRYLERSLELRQEIGDRRGMALIFNNLGNTSNNVGDFRRAITYHRRSMEIFKEIGDRRGVAFALNNLGSAFYGLGDYDEAERLYQQSLRLKEEMGDTRGMANTLNNLGSVYLAEGKIALAQEHFLRALKVALQERIVPKALEALVGIASVLTRMEKYEQAAELFAFALEHPSIQEEIIHRAESYLEKVRSHLSPYALEQAKQRAAQRTVEEVCRSFLE